MRVHGAATAGAANAGATSVATHVADDGAGTGNGIGTGTTGDCTAATARTGVKSCAVSAYAGPVLLLL